MKNVLILIFAFVLFMPVGASAQQREEFVLRNIEVEMPAGNASKLRLKAIDEASKKAFSSLLRNITPKETWPRHAAILDIANFDEVMEKFVIVEEKTVPAYNLTLDVFFNEEAVKKMLAELNVPFSEATGGKVFVIPLLEMPDVTYLWQGENPWKAALSNMSGKATFFQFVLPTGDLDERRMLTPEMARFGAGDVLMKLAQNYGATGAVVAKAKVVEGAEGRRLTVDNLWYGEDSFSPASVSVDLPDDKTFEETLAEAAHLAMEEMTSYWRGSSLVRVDRPGRVFLRYKPAGPRDLENMKKKVSEMSVVKNLKLRVLNVADSIFEVDFYGDAQDMWEKLRSVGFNVATTNMNMVWKISKPEETIEWNMGAQ